MPKDLTNNKQRGKFWEKIKDIVVRRLHILKIGVNPHVICTHNHRLPNDAEMGVERHKRVVLE